MPTLLRTPQAFLHEPLRVMDAVRAHNYLLDWGDEELLQRNRYWQTYASRKELIEFGRRNTRIRYLFDNSTKRYYRQVRGLRPQVVPLHSIKLDVVRFSNNMCRLQREFSQALLSQNLSVQDWYTGTVRLLNYSSRAVVDIARGTSGLMSSLEEREYARVLEEEVEKFNLYAKQVANGSIPLDGRILNAVCSLGKRLNRIFENWKLWDMKRSGYTQARRRLTPAEHCKDTHQRYGCITLARKGWQPIDAITPIGGASCWDGCLCEMEYR